MHAVYAALTVAVSALSLVALCGPALASDPTTGPTTHPAATAPSAATEPEPPPAPPPAVDPPVSETGRQDLFGPWQAFAVRNDPGQAELKATESATWKDVRAPFLLSHVPGFGGQEADQVHYAWARRDFVAPTETAFRNAVLHLHGVRWGSKIWLNGQEIGGHLGAYGAFEFDITDSIRWGQPNQLLVRLTGWLNVPMSKAKDRRHPGPTPLVPHGSSQFRWGNRQSGICGGVWIDYFDYARLEQVLVLGDPADGKVRVRGQMKNYGRQYGRRWIESRVLRDGKVVLTGEPIEVPWPKTSVGRTLFDFDFELTVPNAAAWSPQYPNLYQLQLDLVQENRLLARWKEPFGLRTFEARPEGFFLNGKRFFLRGICTWGQNLGWPADRTTDPRAIQRFLVDLPRAANLNCVRNHTVMLDRVWLDVTDRTGFLVLQEFPITMNYRQPAFDAEELALYHQRCLDEFRSVLPLYWNHPSVVVWVPTNESGFDTEWEEGPLYQMFRQADPSRPIMRAGEPSPDIYDTHCYSGFWSGPEGAFAQYAEYVVPRARAAGKPLTNSEYIENFGGGRVIKWMGHKPADVSDAQWERQRQDVNAQFILEQTEVLRRLGYDGTLPYAWSNAYVRSLEDPDRPPLFTPLFEAVRSGQSPLLASLDLADRHFLTGQPLQVDLVLCDDSGSGQEAFVTLTLLSGEVGFVWPAADPAAKVEWKEIIKVPSAAPASPQAYRRRIKTACLLPQTPGRYYLLAAIRPDKNKPAAVSRRIIDVVAPPAADRLNGRRVAVFAADAQLPAALEHVFPRLTVRDADRQNWADVDVVLIGPMIHVRAADLAQRAEAIRRYLAGGGRVVVLNQDRPIESLGVSIPRVAGYGGASTAFRTGDKDFFAWHGLGPDSRLLRRFNGPTGSVVRLPVATQPEDKVEAMAAQGSTDLDWPVIVTRKVGKGTLVLCQMPLTDHLIGPTADPVAQTILLNLLAAEPPGQSP